MRIAVSLPRATLLALLPGSLSSMQTLRAFEDAWGHELFVFALKLQVANEYSGRDRRYRK